MKPWEATIEDVAAERERLAPRLAEADRVAAPLFARQLAEADADTENDDDQ